MSWQNTKSRKLIHFFRNQPPAFLLFSVKEEEFLEVIK